MVSFSSSPAWDSIWRAEVCRAALSWDETPYHPNACVKHHGVCCAWFIAGSFNEAVQANLSVPRYSEQWFEHCADEWYIGSLQAAGFREVPQGEQQAADIVVSTLGQKVFCHAGIILSWPERIIHAASSRRRRSGKVEVVRIDYSVHFRGALKFFSWF
jgi:hypothetical protein